MFIQGSLTVSSPTASRPRFYTGFARGLDLPDAGHDLLIQVLLAVGPNGVSAARFIQLLVAIAGILVVDIRVV